MDETGSGTNNDGADVQNICKPWRRKRNSAQKKSHKKIVTMEYKQSLMTKLLKSGCSFTHTPENISLPDLEYAEFLLKFPRKKLKNETKFKNQTKMSRNKTKRSRKRTERARSEAERSKIKEAKRSRSEAKRSRSEAKRSRSEAKRLRKYLLKGTDMSQTRNVTINPTHLGQIDNSLETDNILNTPPDEENCYSILTRSRTAVLKHSKLKIKSVDSHDVQPKGDLKINQLLEGQTSQSNTFPAIARRSAFSHPPRKQEEKSEEFRLKILAETTLNYLAENHSLCTPYIMKEIAKAHARLKWHVIYGVLKRRLTDKYTNLDENDASSTWDLNEDDGYLLHSFFPMPYAGVPSRLGLVNINDECVHSPELLSANSEHAQSSDHHFSPVIAGENLAHVSSSSLKRAYPFVEKSSDETTTKVELNCPGTLGVQEIPTPAKVNRNSNVDNPINHGCFYNHGNTMADLDTLYTYKRGSCINCSTGGPDITTDYSNQFIIHNNQDAFQSDLEADADKRNIETFQSDLEADADKHLADAEPKELMFWRKTSSLFGEIKLTCIRLLDVKWKLKKHTLEIDEAYKIMTSVYSEIEQFSHLIIKFKSEQNINGFCKRVPANLKVLHPSEMLKDFNEIQSCLGTLKELCTQIERTFITNAAYNNTASDLLCDSSSTNDSATAPPSSATESALNLSQQNLSDDHHLASASEHVPEISSVRFLPTFESKPPREKKYRTKWCKDSPIHVMSENEALHWSRLQVLYKEIRNKTSCVGKCICKLYMAKGLTKFESRANSSAFLKRLHQKVSEYQAKITAENKENIHFCYASVQAVPGKLRTKRQRSYFVYGLDQVWAAFNKYKALFQRLIDRFGYKHIIGY